MKLQQACQIKNLIKNKTGFIDAEAMNYPQTEDKPGVKLSQIDCNQKENIEMSPT
jgi:hypothetical protein